MYDFVEKVNLLNSKTKYISTLLRNEKELINGSKRNNFIFKTYSMKNIFP